MNGYLMDTNHLSIALERNSEPYRRILAARRAGQRIGTCVPVLYELAVGIEQTARRDSNWNALRLLLRQIRIWPLTIEYTKAYAEIYRELRANGKVLSQVDMMVAALARNLKLTVLTTDRDFDAVANLRIENWLAS